MLFFRLYACAGRESYIGPSTPNLKESDIRREAISWNPAGDITERGARTKLVGSTPATHPAATLYERRPPLPTVYSHWLPRINAPDNALILPQHAGQGRRTIRRANHRAGVRAA